MDSGDDVIYAHSDSDGASDHELPPRTYAHTVAGVKTLRTAPALQQSSSANSSSDSSDSEILDDHFAVLEDVKIQKRKSPKEKSPKRPPAPLIRRRTNAAGSGKSIRNSNKHSKHSSSIASSTSPETAEYSPASVHFAVPYPQKSSSKKHKASTKLTMASKSKKAKVNGADETVVSERNPSNSSNRNFHENQKPQKNQKTSKIQKQQSKLMFNTTSGKKKSQPS